MESKHKKLKQSVVISMLPIEFLGWCIDKGIEPVGKDTIEVPHLKGEMAIPVMTRAQLFDVFIEERGNY